MLIYLVNSAVSLVVATALWLVWLHDREQKFAQSSALLHVAYVVASLSYWAFLQESSSLVMLGAMGLFFGGSALFALAVRALLQLEGASNTGGVSALTFAVFAAISVPIMLMRAFWVGGVINMVAYSALGTYAVCRMWRWGWVERAIGFLWIAVGLNGLTLIVGGAQSSDLMYAIGTVLRVALGFAFAMAALQRTHVQSQRLAQRFTQLSEHSLQGIVVTTESQLLYANPAALKIFGYPDLDTAKLAGPWAAVMAERRHTTEPDIRAMLSGDKKFTEVVRESMRADGKVIHLRLSSWPIQWEGMTAAQIVVIDDTERVLAATALEQMQAEQERQRIAFAENAKKTLLRSNAELEERVQQRTKALEEANRSKSQFLSNMSHEIRTPMNVILGLLKLLQSTSQTAQQQDYLHKAEMSAKSLLGLLNNLLDFSKIDAGKMTLDIHTFEFERLLRDLSAIVAASGNEKPLEVLFDVGDNIPDLLMGDSLRLLQVLVNLTSNAIKFTPQGEVVIQFQMLKFSASEVTLRISVKDTGTGMTPDQQSQIFDLLSRTDDGSSHQVRSNGLGLTICKQLLGLMGSPLQLQSTPGKGSTFYFDIALGVPAEASIPVAKRTPQVDVPLRVLIVDDNPIALELLRAMALAQGWAVEVASSGARAVELVEQSILSGMAPFSAVFLDWEMAGLDGWETLDRVLNLSPSGQPPATVMVSAYGRDRLSERSIQEQTRLNAYLVKPVTSAMLAGAVAQANAGRSKLRGSARIPIQRKRRIEGMRILLVEDNLLNRLVASELLTNEGAVVTTAEDGRSGVQAVEHAHPPFDAVLMDMHMPVLDGCSATRVIRQELKLLEIPIIAMTANTMASDRKACLDAGMNDHVGKPFDINYLISVLLKYAGPQKLQGGAADSGSTKDQAANASGTLAHPLEVERAIADMGGDAGLYALILQTYLQELLQFSEQLKSRLDAGDGLGALRLLHTFKGTSATVGASRMAQVAAWAEAHLKGPQLAQDIPTLMQTLDQCISMTHALMSPLAQGEGKK